MAGKKCNRKCFKCGRSPAKDNVKLFRFPKPEEMNLVRCELWAKYMFPKKKYVTSSLLMKLYNEHIMLCEKHFKDDDFTDRTKQILVRDAVPCDASGNTARKGRGSKHNTSVPASDSVSDMPTVEEVCFSFGLKDVDMTYSDADMKNLTSFKLFQQHLRPLLVKENPKVPVSKLIMLIAAKWRLFHETNPNLGGGGGSQNMGSEENSNISNASGYTPKRPGRTPEESKGTSVLSEENTVTYGSTAALSPSLLETYCEGENDGETDASSDTDNTITPGDVQLCRVCLTAHRLRRMTDRARRAHGLLTGLTPPNDGHLPPYVCVTCAHRVKSFVRFRTDCLRASQLVLDAISKHKQVTQESIRSVAGERRLGSHLSVTHNQTDRYDLQIVHDETQGAPVDYDGLLKPHAVVNVPGAHDEEQDTASDGEQCMPGGDAILYLPTVPNYNTDCDVIVEYIEISTGGGSLDVENAAVDTSNDIDVSEITINSVTDDGDVYLWVPNVEQISTNKDAVPGTAKPIGTCHLRKAD